MMSILRIRELNSSGRIMLELIIAESIMIPFKQEIL